MEIVFSVVTQTDLYGVLFPAQLIFSGLLGNQNLHAHVLLKCEIGKNEFEVVNNHLYCFILIQLLNQQQRHDPLCSCIFKHVAKIEHQS